MNDDEHRATVEAAYARLREVLEAKDVTTEGLRDAALEALRHARAEIEIDPVWVESELRRLNKDPKAPRPGTSGSVDSPPVSTSDDAKPGALSK